MFVTHSELVSAPNGDIKVRMDVRLRPACSLQPAEWWTARLQEVIGSVPSYDKFIGEPDILVDSVMGSENDATLQVDRTARI